jgi:hypothetical protein
LSAHQGLSLVGRYYDPGSGQFLCVHPPVVETDQTHADPGGLPVKVGCSPCLGSDGTQTPNRLIGLECASELAL